VTRRVFSTVGVDGNIEFVDSDFEAPPEGGELLCRTYQCSGDAAPAVRDLLRDLGLEAPFQDLDRDAVLAAERLGDHLRSLGDRDGARHMEVVRTPFFRRKGAYVVGRLLSSGV